MTNRIETTFKSLTRPAFIPFITAGDSGYDKSLQFLNTLAENGADIIEIGMAFTDPVVDGEAIQKANIRALENGADLHKTLQLVRDFRKTNTETPLVLMGYANPIMQYGMEKFMSDAADAGIDGLLIVDIPPEESEQWVKQAESAGIAMIRLITPTTDEHRLNTILNGAGGFLYYVSITGVTGAAKSDPGVIADHLSSIRTQTDLPIAVGFGIKTPDDAAEFKGIADGIVVGSALVQTIASNQNDPNLLLKLGSQVQALADALKN